MAEDTVPASESAPAAEDPAALKAERDALKAEREKIAKERDESAQRAKQWEQRYQSDMAQAVELVKQAAGQQAQPPQEPQDDDGIVSRKELRAAEERASQRAMQHAGQEIGNILRMNRAAHRQAVATDPWYLKYRDEVEAALDGVDPRAAALPDAYAKALSLVKANHFDEVIEDEVKRRTAPPPSDDEYEDEPQAHPARSYQPAPAVAGQVSGRAIMARKRRVEPLEPEEDRIRQRMGVSEDDWRSNKAPAEVDFLGFKGRSRV